MTYAMPKKCCFKYVNSDDPSAPLSAQSDWGHLFSLINYTVSIGSVENR